ncbi:MAG: 30S ribosomal protein S19 [Parcubacteria group bacterium]|nr:30S ribosomal protein S19 [Parcubacteria group bacterium]MBI4217316.1 30S ribosomal protein S19 [Parcubacteria group bacterium]
MARSLKKGPYIDERLHLKMKKHGNKTVIKTWSRDAVITPEMIGFSFGVHNGKDFIPVSVVEEMVGHRLGEFSPTTKFGKHGGKIQRDLEQGQQAAAAAATAAPAEGKSVKGGSVSGGK